MAQRPRGTKNAVQCMWSPLGEAREEEVGGVSISITAVGTYIYYLMGRMDITAYLGYRPEHDLDVISSNVCTTD